MPDMCRHASACDGICARDGERVQIDRDKPQRVVSGWVRRAKASLRVSWQVSRNRLFISPLLVYPAHVATMPDRAPPSCAHRCKQQTFLDVRLMQSACDRLGQQQAQGLHVRGPACWHDMQGILRAVMTGRQTPESSKRSSKPSHEARSRKQSSKTIKEQRRLQFLTSHQMPTLYVSRECLSSQALVLLLERAGHTSQFHIIDIDTLGHVPSVLRTIPALVDTSGIHDGPELFNVLSTHK